MGVKGFRTSTIVLHSLRCPFLLRHDISNFTEMPFFCCSTIFMFAPRCHLLLLHDISESIAPPSFVASRYFRFHRDAHLSALHDTFKFAQTPFAKILLTPRCLAPPFPARSLKIMRRWRRQDQRDVKIELDIYHAFMLDFKYTFYFFRNSAFCSFTL